MKLVDGKWVQQPAGAEFKEDDQVRFYIEYRMPEDMVNASNKVIYYQLPKGIKLEKPEGGHVYQSGVDVGTYIIGTDGKIVITFYDEFADGLEFTGNVQFYGTITSDGVAEDGKIDFGGQGGSITLKRDEIKEEHDVSVKKDSSAPTETEKGKYTVDYKVTVSTQKGTGDTVTVKDFFSTSKNATGKYLRDSFEIVKIDAYGNESPVTGSISFETTAENREGFTITDLPELKIGEQYIVKYKAEVTTDTTGSLDGSANIKNYVQVTTGDKTTSRENPIELSKSAISKTGSYDQDHNIINWTVTINQKGEVVDGRTFKDVLPDGVSLIGDSVEIKDSKGKVVATIKVIDGKTIEYTFPEGENANDVYTIHYQTTAPSDYGSSTIVSNTAQIGDNEAKADVEVKRRDWGVSKNFHSEETSESDSEEKIIRWDSTVTIPNDKGIIEFLYKDVLDDGDGNTGCHYGIAAELQADIEKTFKLQDADKNAIQYDDKSITVEVKFFDENGKEVLPTDPTTHVKSFTINVKSNNGDISAIKMSISGYRTHVDVSGIKPGESLTVKNKAELPDYSKTSEVSHTFKKAKPLSKQSSIDNSEKASFVSGVNNVSYGQLIDGEYIRYRILVSFEKGANDEIILEDQLPEDVEVDIESVKGCFYGNDNYLESRSYDGKYDFDGAQKPKCVVDENNLMTITVSGGYGNVNIGGLSCIAITYKVSIKKSMSDLNITERVFTNTVSWGSESDSQTTVVNRPLTTVEKSAKEILKEETNIDGSIKQVSTNQVDYTIVINPAAGDINPYSGTLILTDTLSMPDGVTAYLDRDNTGLYYYDPNAEDHRGALINPERYTLMYDAVSGELQLEIPDELACVFVYRYLFERGSIDQPEIKNNVMLAGRFSSASDIKMSTSDSSAAVTKGSIKIYKVDQNDITKGLPGAEFELAKYNVTMSKWDTVNSPDGSNVFTSGEDGKIELRDADENTLYRLIEKKAPDGYKLTEKVYYLVFMDYPYSKDDTLQKLKAQIDFANILSVDAMGNATTGIKENDIIFFNSKYEASLYVPNESTTIAVKKVWVNSDGTEMQNPTEDILVTLYAQQMQIAQWTVTVKLIPVNNPEATKIMPIVAVAKGSPVTISFASKTWKFDRLTKECQDRFDNYQLKIDRVDSDQVIELFYNDQYNVEAPEIIDYDEPEGYESVGEKKAVETATLNAKNDWKYIWKNLSGTMEVDGKDVPCYYTVEEASMSGYTVTYLDNNGIKTGNITITNQKKEQPITLPETGGTGTYWYTMGGVLLIAGAAFLIYKKHMQKGGKRIW